MKRVNMSEPVIKARTGGRVGRRMPRAGPSAIVLTIGHSTRTLEEFIGLLAHARRWHGRIMHDAQATIVRLTMALPASARLTSDAKTL